MADRGPGYPANGTPLARQWHASTPEKIPGGGRSAAATWEETKVCRLIGKAKKWGWGVRMFGDMMGVSA
jgi:hypothetical protein